MLYRTSSWSLEYASLVLLSLKKSEPSKGLVAPSFVIFSVTLSVLMHISMTKLQASSRLLTAIWQC